MAQILQLQIDPLPTVEDGRLNLKREVSQTH
jgi:hypothetical protein